MKNLELPCLCLVSRMAHGQEDALLKTVSDAVKGGVGLVQVRETQLLGGQLVALVHKLQQLLAGSALLFVNDRVDVAMACSADGVQLGEQSMSVGEVRKLVGKQMLIGRSVHSIAGAIEAQQQGADLLIVGTIFDTDSKPNIQPNGVRLLHDLRDQIHIPYLGIGGINNTNAHQVMEGGASGIAVMGAILNAQDPQTQATLLATTLHEEWA